jgi:vitamin B12 transporter
MLFVPCLIAAVVLATNADAQPTAMADDEVRPLTPITVIASPASANPANLFTLSRADFAPFDLMTAVDVLRRIPGVNIDRSGSAGSVSSLYLRGGDPNWTAIFLDGVRINDPTNSRGGGVDLSFLDPAMIERVDVIRGPASATLGSDAISGAINIVTRAPADVLEASIDAETGTRGYDRVDVRGAGPVPVGAVSLYGSASDGGSQVEGGAVRLRTIASRFRSSSAVPPAGSTSPCTRSTATSMHFPTTAAVRGMQ